MSVEFPHITDSHMAIIKALYFNGTITCAEISRITGASLPNVAKNVNELIEAGYVVEKGFASSNGGRKPLMYSLVAGEIYIVAVAMDQFLTRMVIVDLHNNFVTDVHEFDLNLYEHPSAIKTLVENIHSLINNSGIDRGKIRCAGIAMPGFIGVDKGINHSFLKVESQSLRDCLSEQIGIPVFMDNDSSAIALAELKFGLGRTKKEIMVINIGWGIGLGMIVDGKIFRGFSGFAGEFSHVPLFRNGKVCSCGKRGCLETEASLITIEAKALASINTGQFTSITVNNNKTSVFNIIAEAKKGDSLAIKLISDAAYHIGQAIAILIHIMNPEVIVLSGKGIKAGKLWLAPIQQAINEHCIPTLTKDTEVTLSGLGFDSELIGAAALVIENISNLSFLKHEKNTD
jgi:predicted NBD/HSP70 family sugar kinase